MQGLLAKHTVKRRLNTQGVDTDKKFGCRQIEETNTKVGTRLVELNCSSASASTQESNQHENNRTIITRLERNGQ